MTRPASGTATLGWGLALVAFTLVIWCYRVASSLSLVIGSGEGSSNFDIDFVMGGESLFSLAFLCFPLSVVAAFLLRMAEASGAVAWRAHPRIPFQMIAWVLAGLFLTQIVLIGILWFRSVYLWLESASLA